MLKNTRNNEHYSHNQTASSRNHCQSDRDNNTDAHAGCDHVHDTWQHASNVCHYEASYAACNRTATTLTPELPQIRDILVLTKDLVLHFIQISIKRCTFYLVIVFGKDLVLVSSKILVFILYWCIINPPIFC